MSKYLELSTLACSQAKSTFKMKQECENLAHKFAIGYKKFLGVPDENFSNILLNSNLDVTEILEGMSRPKLIRGSDSFWYFGFKIHFRLSTENTFVDQTVTIGVTRTKSGFIVKLSEKYELPEDYTIGLESIFSEIYSGSKKNFSKPITEPKTKIGFV